MELDFNKIIRLKKIRIEKSELSEEENALASPILRDKNLIGDIYKIFVELLNSRSLPPCIDSVTQRKKFIFIILYCPGGSVPEAASAAREQRTAANSFVNLICFSFGY